MKALLSRLSVYPDKATQTTSLLTKKITIPNKYSDFAKVFLKEKALVLPKQIKPNKYEITLERDKEPLYGPIYSLGLVELETLKVYIKIHLKTRLIWPSKSPPNAPILFDKKLDNSLYLCINY